MHLIRRLVMAALAVAVIGYIGACAYLFVVQRSYLYHPVAPGSAVPQEDGPPIQALTITTADGERLVAWHLPAEAGRPTILFFNGNAAGLAVQEGRWRRIADQRVGFLVIAYRGYEGSTGTPTEDGLRQDAEAAYGWLRARVPAEDIVIHGFSLGTGVAVRLASEHPARALILEAPYTATTDVAALSVPWAPVHWLMRDQYRSRDRIGGVDMPVLILHGDQDQVIPFEQGERLFQLAPRPRTFVRMVGSNHNTLTRDGAYDHIWRFLGVAGDADTAAEGHRARAVATTEGA